MIVYIDGKFVPEEQALVSVFDRSFRYGDGLFEAVLVHNGKPFRWDRHLARMERSAARLRMTLPIDALEMRAALEHLLARNERTDAIARITLSRGTGPRGYAPNGTEKPLLIMTAEPTSPPLQQSVKVITSSHRVAANDLVCRHKTASRMLNVIAAMEARDADAFEALLVDTDGNVTEGVSSNVFWIEAGTVCTSPLAAALLPGITRQLVIEVCAVLGIPTAERAISSAALPRTDGVFLTMTSRGVVEAGTLDGNPVPKSKLTEKIARAVNAAIDQECS